MTTLSSYQTVANFLQRESKVLHSLLSKLDHLNLLNKILAEIIDHNLVSHCRIVNVDNGRLVLLIESALWATHIRFQVPELLAKLRQHPEFGAISTIHCKVIPPAALRKFNKPHRSRTMPRLSPTTAEIILETAKNIQSDKLQSIMLKIAQHI